jgi:hypothetical protein
MTALDALPDDLIASIVTLDRFACPLTPEQHAVSAALAHALRHGDASELPEALSEFGRAYYNNNLVKPSVTVALIVTGGLLGSELV